MFSKILWCQLILECLGQTTYLISQNNITSSINLRKCREFIPITDNLLGWENLRFETVQYSKK